MSPTRQIEEQAMAEIELRVTSGQVVVLRLFDVAYEIDLRRAHRASVRSRLVGPPPKAVSFGVTTVALVLMPE